MSLEANSQNSSVNVAPTAQLPTSSDIKKGLVDTGGSLMDFIQGNIRTTIPQPNQSGAAGHSVSQSVADQLVTNPETTVFQSPVVEPTPPPVAVKEDPKETPSAEELLESVDQKKKLNKEESYKVLRTRAETAEADRTEKERLLSEAQAQIDKYVKGELLPERAQHLEDEVKRLSRYEQIVTLKTSQEYMDEYVAPINAVKASMQAIADDWQIDVSVLEKAASLDTKKQKYEYLSEFMDAPSVIEAREIVDKYKDLHTRAALAEEAPKETLEQLMEQRSTEAAHQEQQRVNKIHTSARSGWTDAITEVAQEGKYPELIVREGDKNSAYSKQVLDNASSEYGKFINLITMLGAKDLPPEAAKILAKRFALSEAATAVGESRLKMYNEYKSVVDTTRDNANFDRPPVGSGVRSSGNGGEPPKPPQSPTEAADRLLESVLPRR